MVVDNIPLFVIFIAVCCAALRVFEQHRIYLVCYDAINILHIVRREKVDSCAAYLVSEQS